jgi:phospholipid/cholesterol/gamma-HCH transport system ATP-binding protein
MKKQDNHINKDNVVISIRGLEKSFGDNHVLRDINLDIYQGENLVVLGRSGTGKSVLIKIMVGLLKQDRGTVVILGQEPDKLPLKELEALRLKIGFSFQHSALYDSMTVGENLAFPFQRNSKGLSAAEVDRAVRKVLEAVGLSKTLNQLPAELSGGQRKRIGIARTLILQPAVMLYDEPTAGLDPITSMEINNLINEVQQAYHTTSVIITHDLVCAKATGDRLAVLLDGQFKHVGTFEEVMENSSDEQVQSFYDYNFIN